MSKRSFIVGFFVLLFLLHQDFWWRDDPTLVLGILPVSLAYHVFWTVLIAFAWFLVTKFCWPHALDQEALGAQASGPPSVPESATPALPGDVDERISPERPRR